MAVSFPGCDEGTCYLRHFDRNGAHTDHGIQENTGQK